MFILKLHSQCAIDIQSTNNFIMNHDLNWTISYMIEIKLNKLWLNYTWNNYNFICNTICFVYIVLSDSLKSVSNTKLNKYDDITEYVRSGIGFKKEKAKGERTVNWKLLS